MKRHFAMLTAAVAFAALPSFAFAADAIDEVPQAPEAPYSEPVAASGWSGAYGGVYAGHGWGKNKNPVANFDTKGFSGGLYGGYNMQSDSIVYGAEADVGYSRAKGAATGVKGRQGFNGAIRARVGVDFDPILVYGAAGVAATGARLSNGGTTDKSTHIGWTAGAGVEGKITQNIIGRAEFRHNNYGSENYAVGGGTKAKLTENEIRIGAGLKF